MPNCRARAKNKARSSGRRVGVLPLLCLCRPLLRLRMQIKWHSQLGIVAASAALFGFCSMAHCQVQPGQAVVGGPVVLTPTDARQLTATGKATMDATADRAQIRFAVECQNNDASGAQIVVNDSVRRALQAMETLGIEREAIHPSAVNVLPIYPSPVGKDHLATTAGFRVGEIIEIDLQGDQLGHIGSIVETGIKSGANRLEGISFDVDPASQQRVRLITQATKEAQNKAQAMATTLGVQLGSVQDARESGITVTPLASGVNGPLRMEASVTLHYQIAPDVASVNDGAAVNDGAPVNGGAPY